MFQQSTIFHHVSVPAVAGGPRLSSPLHFTLDSASRFYFVLVHSVVCYLFLIFPRFPASPDGLPARLVFPSPQPPVWISLPAHISLYLSPVLSVCGVISLGPPRSICCSALLVMMFDPSSSSPQKCTSPEGPKVIPALRELLRLV